MNKHNIKRLLCLLLALAILPLFPVMGEGSVDFTDDAGRTVSLPASLTRIAPSGTVAQLLLYSFDDSLLVGLARNFTKGYPDFFTEHVKSLPEFGQFYGKNTSLNLEALMAAQPQLIIDMGEKKKSIVEDMDGITAQTGIPTVFIEATLETLPAAYRRLGQLLGQPERGEALAAFAEEALTQAAQAREQIKEPVSVYLAMGKDGLSTNARNSFHAEVLRLVGADNIIEDNPATTGGSTQVSLETIMAKDPYFILADSWEVMDVILTDEAWQGLSAVKEERVIIIPHVPFSFLFNPPSMNRLIGLYWLGGLLYPKLYQVNFDEKLGEFYRLYLHHELTLEEESMVLGA